MPVRKNFFLIIIIILLGYNCNIAGDCKNHILLTIYNNSKTLKIVKFDRGCGATTSNNIQLSLLKFSDSLSNEAGNIFISDSPVGGYTDKDKSIQASWFNDNTIKITYPKELQVFKKDSIVNNFKVIYEAK